MKEKDNIYHSLVKNMPDAFAYHKMIADDHGQPLDYIFQDVNDAFADMTGIKKENIIGQKITRFLQEKNSFNFDWIGTYHKVACSDKAIRIQIYSEWQNSWYSVTVFTPQPDCFVTIFRDETDKKKEDLLLEKLNSLTQKHLENPLGQPDFQEITGILQQLSGAKFVGFNSYEQDGKKIITKAIAGLPQAIHQASELLGYKLIDKEWQPIPERVKTIREGEMIRFKNLFQAGSGAIPKKIAFLLEKMFNLGEVYVLEVTFRERTIGDFIIFFAREEKMQNPEIIQLYAQQVGIMLMRTRAENNLRKSEEQLRGVIENQSELISRFLPDTTLTFVNNAYCRYFKKSKGQLLGQSYLSLIAEEDREMNKIHFTSLNKNRPASTMVQRVVLPDGTMRWQQWKNRAFFNDAGEVTEYQTVANDITRRKLAEEELQKNLNMLNAFLEHSPGLISIIDKEGHYIRISPAAAKILGFSPDEVQGKHFSQFLPAETVADFHRSMEKIQKLQKPITKTDIIPVAGQDRHFKTWLFPVAKKESSIELFGAIAFDITHAVQIEKRIKENEEKYRSIVDQSMDMLYLHDLHGNILDVNKASIAGTGYCKEELLNMNVSQLHPKKFVDHEVIKQWQNWKIGQSVTIEAEHQSKDVTVFPVEIFTGKVFFGEKEYILALVRDITQRRQSQEKLNQFQKQIQEQKQLLESILDNAPIGIWLVDPDHNPIIVNRHFRENTGLGTDSPSITEEEMALCRQTARNAMKSHGLQLNEEELTFKDGKKHTLQTMKTKLCKEDGTILGTLGLGLDITSRKQAEDKLRANEQKLASILNNMADVVWSITWPGSRLLFVSPSAEKIYGRSLEEFRKNPGLWQEVVHPEDKHLFKKTAQDLKTTGKNQKEFRIIKPDGSIAWLYESCRLILAEKGEPFRVDGNIYDITTRKNAEEALKFQLQFEKMVSEISSYFVSLPAKKMYQGINRVLKKIGRFFQVDRTYVFQFSDDGQEMSITHEWCSAGIEPQKEKIKDIPVNTLPWWAERIQNQDHVYIPDVEKLPPEAGTEKKEFQAQDIKSLLCIPIFKNGELFCFLGFDSVREKKEWTEDHILLLKLLAELIANALTKYLADKKIRYLSFHDSLTGLYNRPYLEEEMERLDTERLLPITVIMGDINGLKLINDSYGHHVGDKLLINAASIIKKSCRKEDIVARWGGDEFVILLPRTSKEKAHMIYKRIMDEARNTLIDSIPLSVALGLATKDTTDQNLGDILRTAENQMYRNKLSESRSARSTVISALLKTLGESSHETEEHAFRMQKMAQNMGERIGLLQEEQNRLALLVILHDIGKITIPAETLNKSEPLTDEEWEIMKRHPETGYRIARSTEAFIHIAEDILSHHERWDGTGYPQGLQGKNISILARIAAIVDAFDVMTNGRPYKKPMSRQEAARELQNGSGSQFDPELVQLFLSLLAEGVF